MLCSLAIGGFHGHQSAQGRPSAQRHGSRPQTYNTKTEQWVKRDADSGRFMDVKQDGEKFKGVRREHPGRGNR
jgi:hypothetical protein